MKKNILLITTDQQSATMLSCSGNRDLQTPNMDSLAKDGVRFEKAYPAQPLCIPQRCSWYTGLMPHQHGVTFNVNERPMTSEYMMGQIFRDAGYATGYSGKWHINTPPENKKRHGFEWTNNIRCNGADAGIVPDFKTFLDQTEEKPFLFSASFNNPHNICEASRGYLLPDGNPGMIENLEQLPQLPDNFSIPENEPSIIRQVQQKYKYPTLKWDEFRWRMHRWYYCRLTELVDSHIGELLQVLKESGHWDDTLIVFSSDHGDGNGHHHWTYKQVLYDESARVPFIVTQPNSGLNLVDEKQLINTGIDMIPTLCGLAQIDCPDHLKGLDWSDTLSGDELPMKRDHVITETEFGKFGHPSGYLGRTVRTQHYKYMVYSEGDNHEFFVDMANDPGETINLVGNPNHQDELDRHRILLRNYIKETDDIFPMEMVQLASPAD
ncbi:MAG: sulfatase-like hydrolase/transferase [Kiritimatiellae bacterium]|jgi:arylsulfatase A-like enzyme|nr:sulfatase-like hydrolase/transferase [Kiritimatiellia bacterium]